MNLSPKKAVFYVLTFFLFMWVTIAAGACSTSFRSGQPPLAPSVIQDIVTHPAFSKHVWTAQWTSEEGGVHIYDSSQAGIGFVRPEDRYTPPNQLPQNDELHLQSGGPLLLDLVVVSAAQDSTFLVTALLDYQQVPFSLDGKQGLLHEIKVTKPGDLYIPIEINVSGSGAHDLILVAFRDPYNRLWDQDARDLAFSCLLSGRRAVVVVDNVDRPVRNVTPDIFGVAPPPGIDFGIRVMFANMPASASDISHPSQRQMQMTSHAQVGGTFQYQLWLSNYDLPDDVVNYGLMRFLDFHQVDFKGKDLYVAHFDGRQEAIVDDNFVLPSQPGVHEAQIVYIFDPYKSVLRGEVLAPFVFSSSCLGIEAR